MNVASLFLTVPRQEAMPGVDTRPERLRAWIESLPYTSDRETTQRLIERLHDINHQPLPSTQRMALLDPFTRAFGRLHEALRSATAGPEHLDRLRLLDRFTEQLLIGYKYVINDAQAEPRRWGKPRHLYQAVNLAAHLIHLLLACRYQHYLPPEAASWRELFVYAESHEIPATGHPDFPFASHPLSADRALAEAAMLRLADPFRLPEGQVWELLAYLDRLEPPLHCTPLPEGSLPGEDHLAVCLHCAPGEFARPPESGNERRLWRLVDGRPLRAALEHDLQRLQAGACTAAMPRNCCIIFPCSCGIAPTANCRGYWPRAAWNCTPACSMPTACMRGTPSIRLPMPGTTPTKSISPPASSRSNRARRVPGHPARASW